MVAATVPGAVCPVGAVCSGADRGRASVLCAEAGVCMLGAVTRGLAHLRREVK
jgi:hypothetical protein